MEVNLCLQAMASRVQLSRIVKAWAQRPRRFGLGLRQIEAA